MPRAMSDPRYKKLAEVLTGYSTELKKGDTVLVNYVVRTTDGRVVGKTEDNDPAALTIGLPPP